MVWCGVVWRRVASHRVASRRVALRSVYLYAFRVCKARSSATKKLARAFSDVFLCKGATVLADHGALNQRRASGARGGGIHLA